MFFDPERQAKIEAAKELAAKRWRNALIVIALLMLFLFYVWGYSDGMAAVGYAPTVTR